MVCPIDKSGKSLCGTFGHDGKGCEPKCYAECSSVPDVESRTQLAVNRRNKLIEMPTEKGSQWFRPAQSFDLSRVRSINWPVFMGYDLVCREAPANNPNGVSAWYVAKLRKPEAPAASAPPAASSPLDDPKLKEQTEKFKEDARSGLGQLIDKVGMPGAVAIMALAGGAIAVTGYAILRIVRGAFRGIGRFFGSSSDSAESKKKTEAAPDPTRSPRTAARSEAKPVKAEKAKTPEPEKEDPAVAAAREKEQQRIMRELADLSKPVEQPPPPSSPRVAERISTPGSRRSVTLVDPLDRPSIGGVSVIQVQDGPDATIAVENHATPELVAILRDMESGARRNVVEECEEKYNVRITRSTLKAVGLFAMRYFRKPGLTLAQSVELVLDKAAEAAGKRRLVSSEKVEVGGMGFEDYMEAMRALNVEGFKRPPEKAGRRSPAPSEAEAQSLIASHHEWLTSEVLESRQQIYEAALAFAKEKFPGRSPADWDRMADPFALKVVTDREFAVKYWAGGNMGEEGVAVMGRLLTAVQRESLMMGTIRTTKPTETMRSEGIESDVEAGRRRGGIEDLTKKGR